MLYLGYGAKRRAYDPDYEHVENSKYREYERLEMEGYDEGIKDAEDNRKRNVQVCRTNIIIILLLLNKNLSDRSTFLN